MWDERLSQSDSAPYGIAGPEHDRPDDEATNVTEENGRARHVLDSPGKRVLLGAQVVDDEFDGGVEQLDDENQCKRSDHHRRRNRINGQDDGDRYEQEREDQAFAKRRFVFERGEKSVQRPADFGQNADPWWRLGPP